MRILGSKVCVAEVDELDQEVAGRSLFVGTVYGRHCWAIDENGCQSVSDEEVAFVDLMRFFGEADEPTWIAAGRAVQLVEWARNHRYCGRCGNPTEDSPGERARRCPVCGLLAFPRLAPAVIMLVERDDGRALLARNARWPSAMYSCLAGFVEPGESVEAAVRREVSEEVGIEVGELRYFGSQPWPFPHSLMLGFHACLASGEIACDGLEIAEAAWFAPHDLPQLPGPISIARKLIDDWVARAS
jgi:NAD+ diphosphatase